MKIVRIAQSSAKDNWVKSRKSKYNNYSEVDMDRAISQQEGAKIAQSGMDDMKAMGYEIGRRAFHKKFGYGKIDGFEGAGQDRKVVITFEKHGKKKLLAIMANLEIK